MTKTELIGIMADDAGISKTQANAALNALIEGVTESLQKDGKITFTGFGTFSKSERKARKGVNPRTGEAIDIKAGNTVRFKAGKKLNEAI
ncbi:MAG: HU family DNA-binding protein [Desulfobacterales bacterium]